MITVRPIRPGLPAPLLAVLLLPLVLLLARPAAAPPLLYVARDEVLCDPARTLCLRATLSYEPNDRVLWLWGRVEQAPGPGQVRIMLSGPTRQGFRRYAPFEFRIRGRPTEIVDHRMIPDEPAVYEWELEWISFVPGAVDRDSRETRH